MADSPRRGTKRKVLTLEDRVNVIKMKDTGKSALAISKEIGCGKTQIQNIIRDRDSVMSLWQSGNGRADQKNVKQRKLCYGDIDQLVWDWFCKARSKNIPLTGPLIQQQAKLYSIPLGHDDFIASNGWFQSWQARHCVKSAVLSGEAADVNPNTVSDWLKRLPSIIEGYEPKNIFNADETGLFYRTVPTRSMVAKGDRCKGGKVAKERITVLLCCSATGEKIRPLVIGRSKNPRCFRGNKTPLEVTYEANKRAWMTGDLFTKWLQRLNRGMSAKGRNILLLLDNCPAHPSFELSHVKLVFLPPNTTSHLQPLDAGIIAAVKKFYRQRLEQRLLLTMDDANTASQLAKSIDVKDAILWLRHGWDCLKQSTIVKCFQKCGVGKVPVGDEATTSEVPTCEEEISHVLEDGVSFHDFIHFDDNLETTDTADDWEEELMARARGEQPAAAAAATESDDDDDEDDVGPSKPVVTMKTLHANLADGLDFAMHHDNTDLLHLLSSAMDLVTKMHTQRVSTAAQSKIKSFFMPVVCDKDDVDELI